MLLVREYVGDDMDRALAERGLMKKAAARDGSSIFRAVCEQVRSDYGSLQHFRRSQLSGVQTDHVELRRLVEQLLHVRSQAHLKKKQVGVR